MVINDVSWARPLRSSSELSDREPQSVLDLGWLLEASIQKCPYPLLRGWPRDRLHAGVPSGRDLDVGWQTRGVHQALRIGDRPLVERGDARRERVDEVVERSIRQRAIHVSV